MFDFLKKIKDKLPRLTGWMFVAIGLTVAIALLKPALLYVTLYKLSLAVTAGVIGYLLDRGIFPYARPGKFLDFDASDENTTVVPTGAELAWSLAMLRRAVIISACIIGVCLGA